jgi:branched-chain amino acid transport system substrate-binding protein
MTGEQVRWGFENLDLTAARLQQIGFVGLAQPLKVSCDDHAGVHQARLQQWDGKKWNFVSDVIVADQSWLRGKAGDSATAYAKQKNLTPGCAS